MTDAQKMAGYRKRSLRAKKRKGTLTDSEAAELAMLESPDSGSEMEEANRDRAESDGTVIVEDAPNDAFGGTMDEDEAAEGWESARTDDGGEEKPVEKAEQAEKAEKVDATLVTPPCEIDLDAGVSYYDGLCAFIDSPLSDREKPMVRATINATMLRFGWEHLPLGLLVTGTIGVTLVSRLRRWYARWKAEHRG